jgi:hypothetical protein
MKTYQITANHQGFGEVKFIVAAIDSRDAFSRFKNIVNNFRQWIVTANDELVGVVPPRQAEMDDDL